MPCRDGPGARQFYPIRQAIKLDRHRSSDTLEEGQRDTRQLPEVFFLTVCCAHRDDSGSLADPNKVMIDSVVLILIGMTKHNQTTNSNRPKNQQTTKHKTPNSQSRNCGETFFFAPQPENSLLAPWGTPLGGPQLL